MANKWHLFGLVGLLTLFLVACNSSEQAPTTTESTASDIALPESFSREEDGQTFQFNYPSGWAVIDSLGMISLANSQETLDLISGTNIEETTLPANSFGLQITQLPAADLPAEIDSPLNMLTMMTESASGDGAPTFNAPVESDINGNPAASVTMTLPQGASGEIHTVKVGDKYLFIVAVSPSYADYASTTAAILRTIMLR